MRKHRTILTDARSIVDYWRHDASTTASDLRVLERLSDLLTDLADAHELALDDAYEAGRKDFRETA